MPERWRPPVVDSEEPRIYSQREETESCNKGNHAERSKANQPNHLKWWKKQNKNENNTATASINKQNLRGE